MQKHTNEPSATRIPTQNGPLTDPLGCRLEYTDELGLVNEILDR